MLSVAMTPTLEIVDGATLMPPAATWTAKTDEERSLDAGVFDQDGTPIAAACHRRGRSDKMTVPPEVTKPASTLPGSHLFGGYLFTPHFGHIVIESLGRLWADKFVGGSYHSLLFFPGFGKDGVPDFARQLFRSLGLNADVRVVTEPLAVERLIVPSQLFGRGPNLREGHPVFRAFCKERLAGKYAPVPGHKLYVARTGIKIALGGFIREQVLAENLQAQGYQIIQPECLTIADQIKAYQEAETLLFAEGSALHLYTLVAQPDQTVGIICRRPDKAQSMFLREIQSFGNGTSVSLFSAITDTFIPSKRPGKLSKAAVTLDFPAMCDALAAEGFITSRTDWRMPSDDEINDGLDEYRRAHSGKIMSYSSQSRKAPCPSIVSKARKSFSSMFPRQGDRR